MDPRKARLQSIVGPAAWKPLISEETWHAAVQILMDPARANLPRSGRGLLTGVARCGICGSTVHRGAAPARRGKPGHATYRCRANLGHIGRAAEPVDKYVAQVIVARLQRPDAAALLIDESRPDAQKLRREAQALRTRLDGLAGLLADGVLTVAAVRRESEKLRGKLAEVEAEQAASGRANVLQPLISATDVQAAWDRLDTDRQRGIVEALITVTLHPPGRGTRTFRPETVEIDWVVD
jgi:hypothetical protein